VFPADLTNAYEKILLYSFDCIVTLTGYVSAATVAENALVAV
jgi:hypothetical protein